MSETTKSVEEIYQKISDPSGEVFRYGTSGKIPHDKIYEIRYKDDDRELVTVGSFKSGSGHACKVNRKYHEINVEIVMMCFPDRVKQCGLLKKINDLK